MPTTALVASLQGYTGPSVILLQPIPGPTNGCCLGQGTPCLLSDRRIPALPQPTSPMSSTSVCPGHDYLEAPAFHPFAVLGSTRTEAMYTGRYDQRVLLFPRGLYLNPITRAP